MSDEPGEAGVLADTTGLYGPFVRRELHGGDRAGDRVWLQLYDDGVVRMGHRCDRGPRGVIIAAPALSPEHRVSINVRLETTVRPSVLCSDCGLHGFITDQAWRNV